MTVKKRLLRTAVLALLGIAIGVGVGIYQMNFQNARVVNQEGQRPAGAMDIAGTQVGGPFTLTNQDGERTTEATFAGDYKLIYFGFTYCPAICPTELQKMARTLRILEQGNPELAQKIQPIFISVDPGRDTPEVVKDYIGLFHPRLVGLTGTEPQVEQVKRAYRIFATKVQTEEMQDYTVDHSSFTYFMGPDDEMLGIYRMNDTAQDMAADIENKMRRAENTSSAG